MVKTFISAIMVSIILSLAFIFEGLYVKNEFNALNNSFSSLYEKVQAEEAVENDVLSVQEFWITKKKTLHAFIPHNEIKEIDLWLAETVYLVKEKEWVDSLSKIEVLIELTEQVPKIFTPAIENIL